MARSTGLGEVKIASANDIRTGHIIKHEGKLWRILEAQHTRSGKGGAYMKVRMKEVGGRGTNKDPLFNSDERIEIVILEGEQCQFLYINDNMVVFMTKEGHEEIEVPTEMINSTHLAFLEGGSEVKVSRHEGMPILVELPEKMTVEVRESDPVVRGQTASSSFKPAVLSNGTPVKVPPFIEAGEKIVVRLIDTGVEYVERAK